MKPDIIILDDTASSVHLPKPPIRLPRFTFIHAPPCDPHAKALAHALADRDDHLGIFDFEEPLRRAAMELFCGGYDDAIDLTAPSGRNRTMLPYVATTIGSWLVDFNFYLANNYNARILAAIAIVDHERYHIGGPFERFIWCDADNAAAKLFVAKYGRDGCRSIHFHSPRQDDPTRTPPFTWLANPTVLSEQMAQLERELNNT